MSLLKVRDKRRPVSLLAVRDRERRPDSLLAARPTASSADLSSLSSTMFNSRHVRGELISILPPQLMALLLWKCWTQPRPLCFRDAMNMSRFARDKRVYSAFIERAALQNPWQSVIQTQLIGSGHVECAVILRRRDGAVKAASLGYQPSAELVQAITAAVREPASAREHGVQFNGASYTCVRADQWAVYAKVSDFFM